MTIHSSHPFASQPDPVRRFRGRLGGAVSLWTAGDGTRQAGLTVSSMMVGNGEPGRVLGLVDPDAELLDLLRETGRAVVSLLEWGDRDLADVFGGVAPAPGGAFSHGSWVPTTHGPAPESRSRAMVQLESAQELGWSVLVTATIDEVVMVEDHDPLEHRRGRYLRPGARRADLS